MSEADIHFELYRHLRNAMDDEELETGGITFKSVRPEVTVNGGFADLILYDQHKKPIVVIEAKRKNGSRIQRDIDPYSPKVIRQAHNYASVVGAQYFVTYNATYCVVFKTFEPGAHLLARKQRAYRVDQPDRFAKDLLIEIGHLHVGSVKWDPHHRAFTNRLRVYHQRLTASFQDLLPERLEKDQELRGEWMDWVKAQGWEDDYKSQPAEVQYRFVSQAAYLLMNKLVFYKLLEDTRVYDVPQIYMRDLIDPDKRRQVFDNLIEVLDFEAVYEHDPIFDVLPLSKIMRAESKELLEQLDSFHLGSFDHDVIGQIYQDIIPAKERHKLGQYYTPAEVVDLICRLTIEEGDDKVLDPACGSGGFLVGAYKRLQELNSDLTHQELLNQLKGFDINRFPAHLTAINLALQNLKEETQDVGVEVEDFFLVDPAGQWRWTFGSRVGVGKEDREMDEHLIEAFDAIVGNPPYIRQEQIASKERCRSHLESVGAYSLSKRSDIYAYFFTYATAFLKENSRLGFITSDRWLTTGYGEDLQAFFLDKYKIKAIINFSRQQFDLALISTCVVILERCLDKKSRNENIVKLLQLKKSEKVKRIADFVQKDYKPNLLKETATFRLATIQQSDLRHEDKWGRFLWAPAVYWTVMQEANLVALGDIGRISYGIKTGANDFFYFKEKGQWLEWGIDPAFVRPLLKHHAEMEFTSLREEDLTWWVLDVHWFIKKHNIRDNEQAKSALSNEGHMNLVEYIKRGELEVYHERSSIKGRKIWFDLGELEVPPLALIEVYWRDLRTVYNQSSAVFDKRLYCLWAKRGVDEMVLGGILNSSLYGLMRELHGRTEQGEGLNRNSLMVYEAKRLLLPDPRVLSEDESEAIRSAFVKLIETERQSTEQEISNLRDALDYAVMDAIGMADRTADVQEAVQLLLRVREEGAGQMTDVLVEAGEETERTLEGARRIEGRAGQIELEL